VAVPSTLIMGTAMLLIPLSAGFVGLLAALLIGFGNGISSGLNMTLGADFSPDNGRGQFLGIWRFLADARATGGPVLLSRVTAVASLGAGVAATGGLGFAAAARSSGSGAMRRPPPQRGKADVCARLRWPTAEPDRARAPLGVAPGLSCPRYPFICPGQRRWRQARRAVPVSGRGALRRRAPCPNSHTPATVAR
jgi:hypothetical protein